MKHVNIAALLVLSVGAASAAPFGYQQQVGSSELDSGIWEGPTVTAQAFGASDLTPYEFALYESVDVDGSAEFAYVGESVPSAALDSSNYQQIVEIVE